MGGFERFFHRQENVARFLIVLAVTCMLTSCLLLTKIGSLEEHHPFLLSRRLPRDDVGKELTVRAVDNGDYAVTNVEKQLAQKQEKQMTGKRLPEPPIILSEENERPSSQRGLLIDQKQPVSLPGVSNTQEPRLPTIVFGGIMQNMNKDGYLDYFLPKFLKLVKSITYDFHLVIYENDSNDGTRETLLAHLNASYCTLILEDNAPSPPAKKPKGFATSKARTNMIARARNRVLDYVVANYSHFEYFAMVDMDGVCGGSDPSKSYDANIFKYALLELHNEWDALFFRFEPYYDLWPFRHPELAPLNYWNGGHTHNKIRTEHDMKPHFENMSWPDGLMNVDSAFEMFGLYKMRLLNGTANYVGFEQAGTWITADCEHTAFHRALRVSMNARLRLSRLVYCQGDAAYQELPDSITGKWKHQSYKEQTTETGAAIIIRIVNPAPPPTPTPKKLTFRERLHAQEELLRGQRRIGGGRSHLDHFQRGRGRGHGR
jgi:hypothetical protein